jgi:predicted transglutaminase-like cysteine proteinase
MFGYKILKRGFKAPFFSISKTIHLIFLWVIFYFCLIGLSYAAIQFEAAFLENIKAKYGEYAKRRLVSWQKVFDENQLKSTKDKLYNVNLFFNLIEFKTDMALWGEEDYWATPLEFLVAGAGDCEDYAIAKYFTLIELGIQEEKLFITYVQALELNNQAHMVLTYYETPEVIPLVLDNLNGEILPATERTDLKPVYSLNGKGLWHAKQQGLGNLLGQPTDVKKWDEMVQRMSDGKIGEFIQ